jgi:hypothetical protein
MTSKNKDWTSWKRTNFIENVPLANWNQNIGTFESLIIIPQRRKHYAGFTCMGFVAVKNNIPIWRFGGSSDVVHLGGLTLGLFPNAGLATDCIKEIQSPINIDCLYPSRLLRFHSFSYNFRAGLSLSSMEIFLVPKNL